MSVIDTLKELADVYKKTDNLDLYRQILEGQEEALEMQQQKIELMEENKALKLRLEEKATLVHDGHEAYWYKREDGSYDPIPICSACYDTKQLRVRLASQESANTYHCQNCGSIKTAIRPSA